MNKGMLCAALLWLAQAAQAETRYITDELMVGVYPDFSLMGTPSKLLKSGTRVEVIERRDNILLVRTPDGTEGWLKDTYLSPKAPSIRRVSELQNELDQAQAKIKRQWTVIANTENALKKAKAQLDETQQANQKLSEQLQQTNQADAQLEKTRQQWQQEKQALLEQIQALETVENQQAAQVMIEQSQGSYFEKPIPTIQWYWWVIAGLATLVLGFVTGLAYLDYRIRKRHGGFRIY